MIQPLRGLAGRGRRLEEEEEATVRSEEGGGEVAIPSRLGRSELRQG